MPAKSHAERRNVPRQGSDTGETGETRIGPRIGSLFSGAGGLDMAVEAVFGGHTVWHSEIDRAASTVLAHHWPEVPNLGDISAVDWATVPPVDILCGGFPCQDVSAAGKRAGIKDGTRSGLWSVFADAIDHLRPRIVVIENVRGLLSAAAHRTEDDDEQSGDMESATAAMGNGAGRPVLRAAGAVLGDLADLGYDAQWATVAAADVGAPHRRERVFILASAADATGVGRAGSDQSRQDVVGNGSQPAHAGSYGGTAVSGDELGVALLPTPNADVGRGVRSPDGIAKRIAKGDKQFSLEDAVALLPTPVVNDMGDGKTPQQWDEWTAKQKAKHGNGNGHGNSLAIEVQRAADEPGVALLPTPRSSDCFGAGQHGDGGMDLRTTVSLLPTPTAIQWGKYEPAIRRWESLTRPAPAPTEPNKNGNPRLSAAFSEWLMGWPAGHVTDPAIGISRNDQLRIVGNGVCPQQAVAALRFLLGVATGTHTHTHTESVLT